MSKKWPVSAKRPLCGGFFIIARLRCDYHGSRPGGTNGFETDYMKASGIVHGDILGDKVNYFSPN